MRVEVWRRIMALAGLAALLGVGLAQGHAAGAPATVPVTLKEFAYVPKAVTVASGTARFAITNTGTIEHDFVIAPLKVKSPLIKPGQSATVLVTLKPGTYVAYCDVPGHKELGMVLTITAK